MTPEEMRIAAAECAGFVWYRHPRAERGRFLAHPAIHEREGQSLAWMFRADGGEAPCTIEYMEKEFLLPKYDTDLNAVAQLEECFNSNWSEQQRYMIHLRTVVYRTKHSGETLDFAIAKASAIQRLEAYLRVKGAWR